MTKSRLGGPQLAARGATRRGSAGHESRFAVVGALVVFGVVTAAASEGLNQWQLHWAWWSPDVLAIAQFGPAAGALAALAVWRRRTPSVPWRRVRGLTLLGVGLCVAYLGVEALAWVVSGRSLVLPGRIAGVGFGVVVATQLVGAMGEEIGWRGVLQPLLESRVGRLAASLVTGVAWGLWHLPFSYGRVYGVVFVVEVVVFAVLLGYLGQGTPGQRALVVGVVHWLVNLADLAVIGPRVETVPAATVGLLATVVITVLCLLALRGPLGSRA